MHLYKKALLALLFLPCILEAQSAVHLEVAPVETGTVGDTITVPVIARSQQELTGFAFTLETVPESLDPIRVVPSPPLTEFNFAISPQPWQEGNVVVNWVSISLSPWSFQAGDTLFMVDYLVVSSFADQAIEFINTPNTTIEFFGPDLLLHNYILTDGYVSSAPNTATPTVDSALLIPPGCAPNQATGSIQLFTSPDALQHEWSDETGILGTTDLLNGLEAGTYHFSITDPASGISRTGHAKLYTPNFNLTGFDIIQPDCGAENGQLTPIWNTDLDSLSLDYIWSTGAETPVLSDLPAGSYSLTITDTLSGCSDNLSADLENQSNLYFTEQSLVQPIRCDEINTGSISLDVGGGGASNLAFLWSDGPIGPNRTNLSQGQYTVTVSNAGGCALSRTISVPRQDGLDLKADYEPELDCYLPHTAIDLYPPRLGAGLSYLWSNFSNEEDLLNVDTTGAYTVNVYDEQTGCSGAATFDILYRPKVLDVSLSCDFAPPPASALLVAWGPFPNDVYPVSYQWSPEATIESEYDFVSTVLGIPNETYSVTATDATGCEAISAPVLVDCEGWAPDAPEYRTGHSIANQAQRSSSATVVAGTASGASGDTLCLPVEVSQASTLSDLRFSYSWDPEALDFLYAHVEDPRFNNTLFYQNDYAQLGWSWVSPGENPVLPDTITVAYSICFELKDKAGISTIFPASFPLQGQGIFQQAGAIQIECTQGLDLSLQSTHTPSDSTDDGRLLLDWPGNGEPPYSFMWFRNETAVGTYERRLLNNLGEGLYTVIATDRNQCRDTLGPILLVQENASGVWPGDTDTSQAANHFDLLNIGLAFDSLGPVRPNATLNWAEEPALDWAQSTPLSEVNYKHIDTNGDGLISAADTMAIRQNWGSSYNFSPQPEEHRNGSIPFYVKPDTLIEGETMALPLVFGTQQQPAEEIYGIAFTIDYDPTVVVPGTAFVTLTDSWLGTPGTDLLVMQQDSAMTGRIDVAITRINGSNASGFGEIGAFIITVEDDILAQQRGPGYAFSIDNIRAINFSEIIQPVTGQTTASEVLSETKRLPSEAPPRLFPVPVQDILYLEFSQPQRVDYEVFNENGQLLLEGSSTGQLIPLSVTQLPAGLYKLRLATPNRAYLMKFIRQ